MRLVERLRRKEALLEFFKKLDDSLKENPNLAKSLNPKEEALKPVYAAIAPLKLFLASHEVDELARLLNTLKVADQYYKLYLEEIVPYISKLIKNG